MPRRLVAVLWLSLFLVMTSCMHAHKVAVPPAPVLMRTIPPAVDCDEVVDEHDRQLCLEKI